MQHRPLDRPLVSIGMPVYNGEAYLEDALRCFLDQTVDDLEIVVSDDASTDRTAEISQDLAAKDSRIRYCPSTERLGGSRNFNRVFALSGGRYFRWAAHDDLCAPTYLERCLEALESAPDVVMAHSAAEYIDAAGEPVRVLRHGYVDGAGYVERDAVSGDHFGRLAASSRPHVRLRAAINHYSLKGLPIFGVGRMEAFERTLLHRPFYGADKVIVAELALQGRIVEVPEVLFFRRTHPGASTRLQGKGQRATWADPQRAGGFLPLTMLVAYASAVRDAELSALDRARCLGVVVGKAIGPETWGKLLVPGQRNYLGWR